MIAPENVGAYVRQQPVDPLAEERPTMSSATETFHFSSGTPTDNWTERDHLIVRRNPVITEGTGVRKGATLVLQMDIHKHADISDSLTSGEWLFIPDEDLPEVRLTAPASLDKDSLLHLVDRLRAWIEKEGDDRMSLSGPRSPVPEHIEADRSDTSRIDASIPF
jgi:hypothetical protein